MAKPFNIGYNKGGFGLHIDTRELSLLATGFSELSAKQQSRVLLNVMNRTGDMAFTRVVKNLSAETGAPQNQVRKEVSKYPARSLATGYIIKAQGGFWSLKRFRPSKGKKGVSASPWRVRRQFKSTFFGPGGHVFKRTTAQRLPIEKLWGPAIPRELVRGKSEDIVRDVAGRVIVPRMLHETDRAIARVKAKYGL